MKKENKKKYLKNNIICFVIGTIIFGVISIYALVTFPSNEVSYDNKSSGLSSTNVKGAIDELYKACSAKPAGEKLIEDAHLTRDSYECRYFFRGYGVKNYITFNNELWQVISVECDGTIKIINTQGVGTTKWDSKGYTDWSRPASLNSSLSSIYNNLPTNIKNKVVAKDWNIGAVGMYDSSLSSIISKEKSSTWRGYIALPTVSEYLRTTGNEKTCGTIILNNDKNNTCKNSTWMAKSTNWWMLTPDNFGGVLFLDNSGTFLSNYSDDSSYNAIGIRGFYALYLSADVKITGGDGSQSNPYTIE